MHAAPHVEISDALRRSVVDVGGGAERWLSGLAQQLADVAIDWDLELGPQVHHDGVASVVVLATSSDGSPAVLKLALPHEESRGEAAALRRWAGDGAVRLLRSSADGFVLLLERCRPAHDLWRLPVEEQISVVADILPRLWLRPDGEPTIHELADTAAAWEHRMRTTAGCLDAPPDLVARAASWLRELSEKQPRRLLHGDLNPGNVLAADGDRWVAIDPKPWFGDPAFDLAQLLMNWATVTAPDEAVQRTVGHAELLAERLSLDVGRVLRWAAVKAVGWRAARRETQVLVAAARLLGE